MPNSYAVTPNIIPGNVSVGGNLSVGGNQFVLGTATKKLRLGVDANGVGALLYNLGFDVQTRDDAASNGLALELHDLAGGLVYRDRASVTGNQPMALTAPLFTDNVTHNHTGTVTDDVIYSAVVRGNVMGANGSVSIEVHFVPVVQNAPNTFLKVKFGGTTLISGPINFLGLNHTWFKVVMRNVNNKAVQSLDELFLAANIAVTMQNNLAGNLDTSVDQTLQITIQNGTAGDTQSFFGCKIVLDNTFGPVGP